MTATLHVEETNFPNTAKAVGIYWQNFGKYSMALEMSSENIFQTVNDNFQNYFPQNIYNV